MNETPPKPTDEISEKLTKLDASNELVLKALDKLNEHYDGLNKWRGSVNTALAIFGTLSILFGGYLVYENRKHTNEITDLRVQHEQTKTAIDNTMAILNKAIAAEDNSLPFDSSVSLAITEGITTEGEKRMRPICVTITVINFSTGAKNIFNYKSFVNLTDDPSEDEELVAKAKRSERDRFEKAFDDFEKFSPSKIAASVDTDDIILGKEGAFASLVTVSKAYPDADSVMGLSLPIGMNEDSALYAAYTEVLTPAFTCSPIELAPNLSVIER